MSNMYIRTKDGRIAEVKENMVIKRCSENVLRLVYKDNRSICVLTGNDDIIKQSENLEELCDEFVGYFECFNISYYFIYKNSYDELKSDVQTFSLNFSAYGAIWTDKGLIYVSKMNDKGELELI